jgi:hypothetical protein
VGYRGGINLYEYARDAPTTNVDPWGLQGISDAMEYYGRRRCLWDCYCPVVLGEVLPTLSVNRLRAILTGIEAEATTEADRTTVPTTFRHHALRHCIASGFLAARLGSCACAECLGVARELGQEFDFNVPADQRQSPSATTSMVFANREGLKCAGCTGDRGRGTPMRSRRPPSDSASTRDPIIWEPNLNDKVRIVDCCNNKLINGQLLAPSDYPHPLYPTQHPVEEYPPPWR